MTLCLSSEFEQSWINEHGSIGYKGKNEKAQIGSKLENVGPIQA